MMPSMSAHAQFRKKKENKQFVETKSIGMASTEMEQKTGTKKLLQICAEASIKDFFKGYGGNLQQELFTADMLLASQNLGQMFIQSDERSNMILMDFIESINFNLRRSLLDFINTIPLEKTYQLNTTDSIGCTVNLFSKHTKQLAIIIDSAVQFTFNELQHPKSFKSFYPNLQAIEKEELNKDTSSYFAAFIKKQLQKRMQAEEIFYRKNPKESRNALLLKLLGK
jgi:hypothetical protein